MQQGNGYSRESQVRFCGMQIRLAMLVFGIVVMVAGCCCIGASASGNNEHTSYGYYGSGLTFFAGILAIVAYFIQDPKIVRILILIALVFNGITVVVCAILGLLVVILMVIGWSAGGGLFALVFAIVLIFCLIQLALLALFEYVLWLGYNDAKEQRYQLPTTGGGMVFASAPAPVVVHVEAPPSSDAPNDRAAPAAPAPQVSSGKANGSK